MLGHPSVQAHFQKILRLDGIGQHPDIRAVCQRVWDHIHGVQNYPDWLSQKFEPNRARQEFSKLLQPSTLLLLDDLWTGDAFSDLCLISGEHEGSKCLVTSRNRQLLTEAGVPSAEFRVLEVPALNYSPARRLLCQHAFAGIQEPTDDAWVSLIDRVVARCEHLPLALVVSHSIVVALEHQADVLLLLVFAFALIIYSTWHPMQ